MKKGLLIALGAVFLIGLFVSAVTGAGVLIYSFLRDTDVAKAQDAIPQTEVESEDSEELDKECPSWVEEPGVLVVGVAQESPAAAAGLRRGDIILAVDGEEVNDIQALHDQLDEMEPGDNVTLTILRCEEPEEISVELGEHPKMEGAYLGVLPFAGIRRGGAFSMMPMPGRIEIEGEMTFGDGALVREVIDDTPASAAGLQVGDRILAVEGTDITPDNPLHEVIGALEVGERVTLQVEREGEELTLEATLTEHPDEENVAYLGVRAVSFIPAGRLGGMPMMPGIERPFLEGLEHLEEWEGFMEHDLSGALVVEVEAGSSAEEAGVLVDDLITAVDGETLDPSGAGSLAEVIRSHQPGDTIELTVRRDDEELTLEATLGATPDDDTAGYLGVKVHAFFHRWGSWSGDLDEWQFQEQEGMEFHFHRFGCDEDDEDCEPFEFQFHWDDEDFEGGRFHFHSPELRFEPLPDGQPVIGGSQA